jgi:hypothetical protein
MAEAKVLLAAATAALDHEYPDLTLRLLDFEIWEYERAAGHQLQG